MIGIFDSGSGGLTVARAIRERAPNVDIFYIGDIANVPYGDKSVAFIEQQTVTMIRLLREAGTSTIVSACNSISATVIRPKIDAFPIIEMVGPTIRALVDREIKHVTLFATAATVRSGMYEEAARAQGIEMQSIAIPGLAERIEEGRDAEGQRRLIQEALQKTTCPHAIFGCTHYPFARALFEGLSPQTTWIDPAESVAKEAIQDHGVNGNGGFTAWISKPSEAFTKRLRAIQETLTIFVRDV